MPFINTPRFARLTTAAALLAAATAAQSVPVPVQVTVTIENLAPTNSISFAPQHLGFNTGSFDAFNLGGVAGAVIVSVAEGGVGGAWQAAFGAADPGAVRGTIGGPLGPGASKSAMYMIDTAVNPYFTFAAMAIPSNDFFIGNDSPAEYKLFNAGGSLQINTITVKAHEIWDAGSQVYDPAAAAFLVVGNNSLRTPQHSTVALNFAEFYGFNGLTTGAGYTFNSQLAANSDVYRISFSAAAVPEPQRYALMLAGRGLTDSTDPAHAHPPESARPLHLLRVEDDNAIADALRLHLEQAGYRLHREADGGLALAAIDRQRWDLVLLDLMLPGADGLGGLPPPAGSAWCANPAWTCSRYGSFWPARRSASSARRCFRLARARTNRRVTSTPCWTAARARKWPAMSACAGCGWVRRWWPAWARCSRCCWRRGAAPADTAADRPRTAAGQRPPRDDGQRGARPAHTADRPARPP